MNKKEHIEKYGIESWERFCEKARNRYRVKQALKGKPVDHNGIPCEADRNLMKEVIYGPIPEIDWDKISGYCEESTARQDAADKVAYHIQRRAQGEWNRTFPLASIITSSARCFPSKGKARYEFELVTGKAYTAEMRVWFRDYMKETEKNLKELS